MSQKEKDQQGISDGSEQVLYMKIKHSANLSKFSPRSSFVFVARESNSTVCKAWGAFKIVVARKGYVALRP